MDELEKQLTLLRRVALSHEEKSRMLERVLSSSASPEKKKPALISRSRFFPNRMSSVAYALGILALLILSGSGIVSASGRALPGERLYGIKVGVAEPLQISFVRNPEKRALLETRLVERRLEEAELLAARGDFDEEAQGEVVSRFVTHIDAFESQVKKLEEEGYPEVAREFSHSLEAKINAHTTVLRTMLRHVAEEQKDRVLLLERAVRSSVGGLFAKERISSSSGDGFFPRKKTIEDRIGGIERALPKEDSAQKPPSMVQELVDDAHVQLFGARETLREAEAEYHKGNSREAIQFLENSLHAAEEAEVAVRQGLKFEKEVSRDRAKMKGKNAKDL